MIVSNTSKSIIDKVLLPHTTRALLLLIPITFLGFYPSYYSTFKATFVIHLHGALMVLWLTLVILQPTLIKANKLQWHRYTGRISYVLVPGILVTLYWVIREGYLRVLGGDVVAPPEYYPEGATALTKAADFTVIGSVYFLWLLIYYSMGIIFRNRVYAHATYMLAAALTILGPSGDRLIYHICNALGWEFNAVAENFVYGIVFLVFGSLLLFHRKKKWPLWPTVTVLTLHLAGVFLYYFLSFHPVWDKLAAFLFSSSVNLHQ